MRIISGKFKSRRLKGTPPAGIRPTSDKLRETLFNVLGARVEGATFLDGCAGVGAIGIEAISRGAAFVYFVEQSHKACQMIRESLKALEASFDIAFIDPPYERDELYEAALERFGNTSPLAPDGLLIMEHSKR